ncbi:methyl-accepting chemotaxis protein [Actinoplanes awajinensis]|uniref:Chemotaxis protein n=1 Tax=Actinoplanes awajinensis subsp. mycoplanecinus TaxID=135947 RepID=A0A124G8E8_9ACTN|nr:methyl-accepting chemotaxis protein [Actinoplanes awajinensis]KUL25690.1 chemotaxis protein [Actinoplanes awajinensis subsp. mycoplanecinus]
MTIDSYDGARPSRRGFGDLPTGVKILSTVGLAGVIALSIGVTGLSALAETSATADKLYSSNVRAVAGIGDVRNAVTTARLDAANLALSLDTAAAAKLSTAFDEQATAFTTALEAYRTASSAGQGAVVDELEALWAQYTGVVRTKLIPAGLAHDNAAYDKIRAGDVVPIMDKVTTNIAALIDAEAKDAAADAAAARTAYEHDRTLAIALLIGGLLAAAVAALWVSRGIVRSLARVEEVCKALAEGDLTHTAGLTTLDEPGRMGRELDMAVGRLRQTVATINSSAVSLAQATEEISENAEKIAGSAEQTSHQAQTVADAAHEVSASVDTVSAGGEEMAAAIREISQNAAEAARVAQEAVAAATATSITVNQLGASSAEIGNVIKVITAIAAQTNLLALNATIEAARAGDAGKGFAVVAAEVKDLAQETAKATEEISQRVEAIQADTGGAVSAIEMITEVITRISDFQTTIASAVEEQTATTAEMNRSVSEAAGGTSQISRTITGVADAAHATSEGVAVTRHATAELSRMSNELTTIVAAFRY